MPPRSKSPAAGATQVNSLTSRDVESIANIRPKDEKDAKEKEVLPANRVSILQPPSAVEGGRGLDSATTFITVPRQADHGSKSFDFFHHDVWFRDIKLYGREHSEPSAPLVTPIQAHKAVLASKSKRLFELFIRDRDFIDSNATEFTCVYVDHASLVLIVNYIYTGHLKVRDLAELKKVFIGAGYLQMVDLIRSCEQVLAENVTDETCIDDALFVHQSKCSAVVGKRVAVIIACKSFEVSADAKFLLLDYADVCNVLKVVLDHHPSLNSTSLADFTYNAIIAWLGYPNRSSAARRQHAEELLSMVELNDLSHDALVRASTNVVVLEFAKDRLLNAMREQLKNIPRELHSNQNLNPVGAGRMLRLEFHTMCSRVFSYRILSSTRVDAMKKTLQEVHGFFNQPMRLIYGGKQLADHETFDNIGVGDGSRIQIVLQQSGCVCACAKDRAAEAWAQEIAAEVV